MWANALSDLTPRTLDKFGLGGEAIPQTSLAQGTGGGGIPHTCHCALFSFKAKTRFRCMLVVCRVVTAIVGEEDGASAIHSEATVGRGKGSGKGREVAPWGSICVVRPRAGTPFPGTP